MGLFTKKYNPDQILDLINQLPDEEKKALQLNTKHSATRRSAFSHPLLY